MQQIVDRCGANVRRLRIARALSLSELARRSGVAKGTLSKLEAGTANPTLETLYSLAQTFGIPFADLVSEPRDEVFLLRAADAERLAFPGLRAHVADRVFGREVSDLVSLTYLAGQVREAVPDVEGTITRVYVAEGRIDLDLPGQTLKLSPGDFVRFRSDVAHRYTPQSGDARVLAIVSYGGASWRQQGQDPLAVALEAAELDSRRGAPLERTDRTV